MFIDGGAGRNKLQISTEQLYRLSLDNKPNDGQSGEFGSDIRRFAEIELRAFSGSVIDVRGATEPVRIDAGGTNSFTNDPIVIYGSAFADSINRFSFVEGSQTFAINGGAGNDFIFGRDGNDRIDGGDGKDTIYGGLGADTIQGNAGNDAIEGGGGADALYGNGGSDMLVGGNGNDRLFGGPNDADTVSGGAGTDSAADDDKDFITFVENLLT